MQAMAKAKDSDQDTDENHPVRANALEERIRVNLVRFIEESGYTMTQVADLAGIPQANLGRYARGENQVPSDVLLPLSQVFGRQVADFYDREPPPPPKNLNEAQPFFMKSRPGFEPSEEDLADINSTIERIRNRRAKKPRR